MPFAHPAFDDHEQVLFCNDHEVGLQAIIAVHSTARGPAVGSCDMLPFESVDQALSAALRTSEQMSLKNAMAGLQLGGGKAVIIGDPSHPNKAELLRRFAEYVQGLGGRYWSAHGFGVDRDEADFMATHCDFIFSDSSRQVEGFNSTAFTALGTYVSMQAAAQHVFGSRDLSGRTIALQGVGSAGTRLAELLHDAGASLVVSDVSSDAVQAAVDRFGATVAEPGAIHTHEADVFAPCATAGTLDRTVVSQIAAPIVCGLANNQLAEPTNSLKLFEAGVTYVPDVIASSGAIVAAGPAVYSDPDLDEIHERVLGIYDRVLDVLALADEEGEPPMVIAERIARNAISWAR